MWLEHLVSSTLNRMFASRPARSPAGLTVGNRIEAPHGPVVLPELHRCEHVVIVGKTGSGKTHFLESLACQVGERKEGFAFFDFHGDASLSLIRRLQALPQAEQRLVVLDPSHPTRSPGINVLEAGRTEAERFRKVSEISSILRQRWGVDSFGARTEELLRNSLYTLAGSGHTLADLPRILTDTDFRHDLAERLEHPDIQSYWRERYQPLSEGMKSSFREPLLNKVTAFLTEPAARHLLCQPESTFDIAAAMGEQKWIIVRLPKGRLREHAHTLGNLLFAQLQFAAMARETLPIKSRRTFTLFCDEVQNLAENDLATLITEGRKFGISVITANQFWEQLPKELRGCLLSAASHVCFRVSSSDASVLANELSLERRNRLALELTNLARGEAVGRFGSHNVERFRVPALPSLPQLERSDLEALIEPVTRPRQEIEEELRGAAKTTIATPAIDKAPVKEGQHDW